MITLKMIFEFSVLQSKQYWCLRASIDYEGILHVGRKLAKKGLLDSTRNCS